jgi:hypothetical protein
MWMRSVPGRFLVTAEPRNYGTDDELTKKLPRTTQGSQPANGIAARIYFGVKVITDTSRKFHNHKETSEFFVAIFVRDGKAKVGRSA